MRPPLPEELIGEATIAKLVLKRVGIVKKLDVILAVPEQLVVAGTAPLEAVMKLGGILVVRFQLRQFLARPKRGKPKRADVHVRSVERDVIGVALFSLENAVVVLVPGRQDVI